MEDGMGERKKLLSVDRKEGNMKKPLIWLMQRTKLRRIKESMHKLKIFKK